jgi:hypothetical protein
MHCNLAKASRILRILRMHAHDLDLKPSLTEYKRWSKGSCLLRFSKTGDHNLEDAYARHFVSPRKGSFGAGVKDVLVDSAGTMKGDQHATRDERTQSKGHGNVLNGTAGVEI